VTHSYLHRQLALRWLSSQETVWVKQQSELSYWKMCLHSRLGGKMPFVHTVIYIFPYCSHLEFFTLKRQSVSQLVSRSICQSTPVTDSAYIFSGVTPTKTRYTHYHSYTTHQADTIPAPQYTRVDQTEHPASPPHPNNILPPSCCYNSVRDTRSQSPPAHRVTITVTYW
jgi:hypothetical protein